MGADQAKFIDDQLDVPNLDNDEKLRLQLEQLLGATAMLLKRRGRDDLVSALLTVKRLGIEWPSEDYDDPRAIAVLEIDTEHLPRFTDQVLAQVLESIRAADRTPDRQFVEIKILESLPLVPVDWRSQLANQLAEPDISNQGRTVRHQVNKYEEDGFLFSHPLELRFYSLLKKKQESLPANETFSIFPLPGQRVAGKTFEPDFLIIYEGRAAVIELDGGHHVRRRAADQSRDRLMKNAGIRIVERLAVEEVKSADEVTEFIESVLKMLVKS